MGAHALGAAAYAAKAAGLAAADRPDAVSEEVRWQLSHMSAAVRAALRQLPTVGENQSGPLGRGLLSSGLLGTTIHDLQGGLTELRPGSADLLLTSSRHLDAADVRLALRGWEVPAEADRPFTSCSGRH
jgi:hypothetical protein